MPPHIQVGHGNLIQSAVEAAVHQISHISQVPVQGISGPEAKTLLTRAPLWFRQRTEVSKVGTGAGVEQRSRVLLSSDVYFFLIDKSMAGYSGKPLAKKLGIKEGATVVAVGAPDNYIQLLEPLPEGVQFSRVVDRSTEIVHHFSTRKSELAGALALYRRKLAPQASVWVSWPKKTSKLPSEITENTVRGIALPLGFVDVKVCAIDETWSGLKLVVRKELR